MSTLSASVYVWGEHLGRISRGDSPWYHLDGLGMDSVDPLTGHLTGEEFPPAPMVRIFEHFAEYEHLYRALLGEKGSPWFAKKMRNYLASLLVERVTGLVFNQNAIPLADQRVVQEGFVPTLMAGQLLDAISWWLEHDRPYPPKQIARYCHRLIIASMREVNTWG